MAGKKGKSGRYGEYRDEYCEELIEHMTNGYSIESFAGVVNVCRTTLYNWFKDNEDFAEAKDIGMMKSLFYWETLGIKGVRGDLQFFKGSPYVFMVKNRFPDLFKDRKEIDVSSKTVMSFQDGIDKVSEGLKSNPELLDKIEEELLDE